MYVKRHAVIKGGKRYVYLRLVRAYRDADGRVRHEVLRTLGREDELKASGQLDQLAASFARLDPPPAGTRRHVGPLLLVHHYLHRLGLVEVVDAAAPMRGRAMLTHGEVIAALVANRLCAPAPLYDIAGWASSAAMAELFAVPAGLLNDDRLGRALEALTPVAEQVRGELALAAASRCSADLSRLHLDMTAVRFTGGYTGSALVAKGWAADRTIGRQVKTMQVSTRAGVPVYYRPHPGASNEVPCFTDTLERIRELAPPGVVCVIDSGFGHLSKLCAADNAGLQFVVPLRRHRLGGLVWRGRARRAGRAAHPAALPATRTTTARARPHRVERRAAPTRHRRRRHRRHPPATHRLHLVIRRGRLRRRGPRTRPGQRRRRARPHPQRPRRALLQTKKQVDDRVAKIIGHRIADLITVTTGIDDQDKPTIAWHRNPDAITSASALDGLYALATNLSDPPQRTLTALDVLDVYKDQWIVEQRHRDLKQTLHVQPDLPAQRRPHPSPHRRHRHRPARLRPHRGRPRRSRPRHPTARHPARAPRRRAHTRAVLAAFTDLHATYTNGGLVLDRLTTVQRLFRPRPPRHPPTTARNTQHPNNIQNHKP